MRCWIEATLTRIDLDEYNWLATLDQAGRLRSHWPGRRIRALGAAAR